MKLLFTGDICVSGSYRQRLENQQTWWTADVQSWIDTHDAGMVNLEGPLLSVPETVRIYNPPTTAPYLQQVGFSYANLANNHTTDAGIGGLTETIHHLQAAEMQYLGAGNTLAEASHPIILSSDGVTIAIVAATHQDGLMASDHEAGVYAPNWGQPLAQHLRQVKAQADFVIFCYHGDEEYTTWPWPARRRWLRQLAQGAVDAIICHHPHVPQGLEWVGDVPIMYSLGNAIFDVPNHYHRPYTDIGLWLSLNIEANQRPTVEVRVMKLDRAVGTVSFAGKEALGWWEQLCDWDHLEQNWRAEAARVIRQSHLQRPASTSPSPTTSSPSSSSSFVRKLTRFSFYRTLLRYLRYRNTRALLFAAIRHWLSPRA